MSDDMSKRERQKARRAEKLQREAAQAKTDDRKRKGVYGLVVLVVVALIGLLVVNQITTRNEQNAQAAEVAEKLDALGCTEDVRMADLGGGHISGTAEALAAESPEVIYTGTDDAPGEPPSSGRHIGQVVPSGVFPEPIDPRLTTHNLEHGYIVAHHSPDAPESEVAALEAWAEEQIDGDHPKIVVAPYYQPLPDGMNVSFTAWFQRQMCETFDADVADVFTRAHYDTAGEGPEKGIATHTIGQQGVLDPEGEPLFLPPLDERFGTASQFEEVEEAEPASPTTDPDASPAATPAAESTEG